ncbi:MAG TPA: MBL fold metallo-hydrolase [Bacteroidota bacterium]|nr:MBL fold metallo-hydrolase [Bacteroidota bacterium]
MNNRSRLLRTAVILATFTLVPGCSPLVSRFTSRMLGQLGDPIQPAPRRISSPILSDVGLSVLWVGHATTLIQIHDKVIITDPVFTNTVGLIAKREVAPGIDPSAIPHLDAILISHVHMDHFSYSSLAQLPGEASLLVPAAGIGYTPEFGFAATVAMKPWQVYDKDGLRITAVPVRHFGGRYGFDAAWNDGPTWTGYVIEYKGTTVLFAGDTAYDPELFKEIGRQFHIDAALIPIAPVEPREYMRRVHADPADALEIFRDVGARIMIPIHHDTFFQGLEPNSAYAVTLLRNLVKEQALQDRVTIPGIGDRIIIKE